MSIFDKPKSDEDWREVAREKVERYRLKCLAQVKELAHGSPDLEDILITVVEGQYQDLLSYIGIGKKS